MPTDAVTAQSGIPKPHPDNTIAYDMDRIALAMEIIGTLIFNASTAIDGKAATVHQHAIGDVDGLQAALDALTASIAGAPQTLEDLDDTDVGDATHGMVLQYLSGTWQAVAAKALHIGIDAVAGLSANNVQSAIAELKANITSILGAAPETLDTLNELAAALGDDPNFAATVAAQIAAKANSADLAAHATQPPETARATLEVEVRTRLNAGVPEFYDEDAAEWKKLGSGSGALIGTMIPWFGLKVPEFWVLVDTVGQVFSRSLFPDLLNVFAPEFAVSYSNGNAVVTGIDCPQKLKAGWPVEGANIPAGTTILTVDSPTQITLSANPTGDGAAIRIFPHGNGDGATTAHYPSVMGRVVRGLDSTGMLNPDADNVVGETQEDALQNITGGAGYTAAGNRTSGAFYDGPSANVLTNSGAGTALNVSFDASRVARTADETRVKAVVAPYIVKVADGVDDPAIVAAAQVVADLAAAQADIAALQAKAGVFAILEHQQPSGTSGGTPTANSWEIRKINTEVYDPNGIVTLSSFEFTVAAACMCYAEVFMYRTADYKCRIYNVTDGVVTKDGMSGYIRTAEGNPVWATVRAPLEAGKTYRIEANVDSAFATHGLGYAVSHGVEVYDRVFLEAI